MSAPPEITNQPKPRREIPAWLPPIMFGMILFGGWEAYVKISGVSGLLLPPPSAIILFMADNGGLFFKHTAVTLGEILTGCILGAITGLGLGVAMHTWKLSRQAAYPWLVASQMIPIAALAPVLVLWLGFGFAPKVAVVMLVCFFPVAVNTVDGLRAADPEMIRLLRTFGAGRGKIIRAVCIPAALPHLFTGFRLAAALSVVAAVFGEWVGADAGLGYLMLLYTHRLQTDGLFAAIAALALLGIALFFLVGLLERLVIPWHRGKTD